MAKSVKTSKGRKSRPRPSHKHKPAYRRVLLKISGEGLSAPQGFGLGGDALEYVTSQVAEVRALNVQVAIVVGGGNIIRGTAFARDSHIPEATAHQMGMLATLINALALRESFEAAGMKARVLSNLPVATVCEPFDRHRCMELLDTGRVVILAGGTGRPFVTTDTAAALAAVEIGADALFKATQVDGVYSADPHKNPHAEFYPKLSYDRVINERLAVMDLSAVDLCQRNDMPIVVFNLHQAGNMKRAVRGQNIGTVVTA